MNDPDTAAFVARFLGDVADIVEPRPRAEVVATLTNVGALLAAALENGGDAWLPLYLRIAALVDASDPHRRRAAHLRLQRFVDENADLAGKELARA
jgi:hypothetical protein